MTATVMVIVMMSLFVLMLLFMIVIGDADGDLLTRTILQIMV